MIRAAKHLGLEWEAAGLPEAPTAPETLKESGLTAGFLNNMILRTLYTMGGMLGLDLARYLCLPFKVIEDPLRFLKDEKCIEVTGGDLIGRISYHFTLTDVGRHRAQDAMKLCAYVGPAPVPLEDYGNPVHSRRAARLLRPPRDHRRALQRHRSRRHQRTVGVYLRSPRQRQDVNRPLHRRVHEQ